MTEPENWLPVAGYEGYYEVSDLGRVRSIPRMVTNSLGHSAKLTGVVLKPGICGPRKPGYQHVILSKNGIVKDHKIHRLVAEAFCEGREPGLQVCHNDGNSLNNRVTNLRWDTQSSNERDKDKHGKPRRNGMHERTHCKNGHEFNTENTTYTGTTQGRRCRICKNLRTRKWREKNVNSGGK